MSQLPLNNHDDDNVFAPFENHDDHSFWSDDHEVRLTKPGVVPTTPPNPKLEPRSITFTIPGAVEYVYDDHGRRTTETEPGVTVTATEDGAGDIDVSLSLENTSTKRDEQSYLGGVFFDINQAKLPGLAIDAADVSGYLVNADKVTTLGDGIDVSDYLEDHKLGNFDAGVKFGTPGRDDSNLNLTSATFVLTDPNANLSLDDLSKGLFDVVVTRDQENIYANAPSPITANAYTATTPENAPITIPISSLVSDPNSGATYTITQVTQPTYGSVTISPDGQSLIYNPDPGGAVLPLDYEVNGVLTGNQVAFQYAVKDSLGGVDSNTVTVKATPVETPPTVTITALPSQAGDPVTESRFEVTATSADFGTAAAGSDFIQGLQLGLTGNQISGATISDTAGLLNGANAIATSGNPGQFSDEIIVDTPTAGQNVNDTLAVTATGAETEGFGSPATATQTATQNIVIANSQTSQDLNFQTQNQSIWNTGGAQGLSLSQFLGINTSFSTSVGGFVLGTGLSAGVTVNIKAGLQANLTLSAGSFNANLPFDIGLDTTYNQTSNTLVIDPTATALAGGAFSTTGPGGSVGFDAIFDAMAKYHAAAEAIGFGTSTHGTVGPTNVDQHLFTLNASQIPPLQVNFGNTGISATFAWPQVNTSGSGGGASVSGTGTSPNAFAALNVDLLALAFDLAGLPDPFNLSAGPFGLNLISLNANLGAHLQQEFNLLNSGFSSSITLPDNTVVPFAFGTPLTIDDASAHGVTSTSNLTLNLTPTEQLQNQTNVTGTFDLNISLLTASINAGPISTSVGPALTQDLASIPLGGVNVYNNTFAVNFGQQSAHFAV